MRKLVIISLFLLFVSQIVFAQNTIKLEGKPQKIFSEDQIFMRPVWSPAGDKIAFTGPNQKGIWIFEISTEKIIQITDKDGTGYKFSWSPNGEYIAFRAKYTDNYRSVMALEAIEVNSKKVVFLTPQQKNLGLPQWGKDNSSVFVTQKEKLKEIKTGIQLTKALSKTKPKVRDELIFSSYGKLKTAQFGNPDSVKSFLKNTEIINSEISPSGDFVVCEEYGGDLIVIDLKNNKRKSLGTGYRPAWSSDGNWISYMVTEDDGHQYLASDIYISSFDGKHQFNITETDEMMEMNPSWSPDGISIVYDEFSSGTIYIQRLKIE